MVFLKDINLIPKQVIIKHQYSKFLKNVLTVTLIILVISIITDVGVYLYKKNYDRKIALQEQQIGQMIGAQTNVNILQIIDQKRKYREEVLKKIDSDTIKVAELINTIESLSPKDITISNLSIDEEKNVKIKGKGDSEESILDFYHNLKTSDLSDQIQFNMLKGTIGNQAGLEFSFEFKLSKGGNISESQ